MKKNGLEVYIDGAMNIHGFLRAGGDESEVCKPSLEKKRVVTGSHFDTVIGGGRLDGGLGVIAGLFSFCFVLFCFVLFCFVLFCLIVFFFFF